MKKIKMDTDNMEKLVSSFEKHVSEINEIFNSIEKNSKLIDGSTDIWKGRTQESVYESYNSIAESFPRITSQMDHYLSFVKKSIDDYVITEDSIENSINSEYQDLSIN